MERLNTVLIVEDQELNRELLTEILKEKYFVLQASDGIEALDIISKREDIKAIILDIIMPNMDGFRFMEEISKIPEKHNIPIIVASEYGLVENEQKALELGAYDFVAKPYVPAIVSMRVSNAIEHSRLETYERLKYLEEFDKLTGIYNKDFFITQTRNMLNSSPKEQKFAIVRFDVTHFSMINSFYGLEEGDGVLEYMAEALRYEKEEYNDEIVFGRIGADDFAFTIPFKEESEIYDTIDNIREFIGGYELSFNIVLIFGVYIITDRDQNVEAMLDNANTAAKGIKGNYINTVAFYDERVSAKRIEEQEIANDMKQALKEEQFVVFLQPKYNAEAGLPCGAEALIRWKHPQKGMIPPGKFIPVFESNGFVEPIDHYMWEHVCMLLRKWIDSGKTPNPVSVNVSRVNLFNPHIVEEICALTSKYDIPRKLLQLEITESAYTDNEDYILSVINSFHAAGFTILMDDFGSGYSSLNVLKDMNVDVLKIDMKFFGKTQNTSRAETIISSVVRMAKWLNIATVAEGVETREQVEFLKGIGCLTIQGYYYAKPMPVEEYEKLVESGVKFESEDDIIARDMDTWTNSPEINNAFANAFAPVCLCEVTPDNVEILRVNQAYYDLFGYEDRITFSKCPMDKTVEEDKETLKAAYMKAAMTDEQTSLVYHRYTANNEMIKIEANLKRMKSEEGRALILTQFEKVPDIIEDDSEEHQIRHMLNNWSRKCQENAQYTSIIPPCSHIPELVDSVLKYRVYEKHALILLSIDNKKDVEEYLSEYTGPVLWSSMENIVNQYFRNNDMVVRTKENEYCIFMQSVPSEEIVSHKCQELFRRLGVFNRVTGAGLRVSIGVAISNADTNAYESLYSTATEALNRCREQGGNKVYIMTESAY